MNAATRAGWERGERCIPRWTRRRRLVLLETGALIDASRGEAPPPGVRPMPPTSRETVESLRRFTREEAQALVVRAGPAPPDGETPLIGPAGPLSWKHGFSVSRLALMEGEQTLSAAAAGKKVLFVHAGALEIGWSEGRSRLDAGDTITLPEGLAHSLKAPLGAVAFVVRSEHLPPRSTVSRIGAAIALPSASGIR